MSTKGHGGRCILCGDHYEGWGHNPEPLIEYSRGQCCTECNTTRVIPARMAPFLSKPPEAS
jgi:hypothetical protein